MVDFSLTSSNLLIVNLKKRRQLRVFIFVISTILVVGCTSSPPKIEQASSSMYISKFLELVDTYCQGDFSDAIQLEAKLKEDNRFVWQEGKSQPIYLYPFDKVTFGILIEEYGCVVDMLENNPNQKPVFTYRSLFYALHKKGYTGGGGIAMRGQASIDRHYVTASGSNVLLYSPRSIDGKRYISLYSDLFRNIKPTLFFN